MLLGSIHSFSKHLLSAYSAPGVKDAKGSVESIDTPTAHQPYRLGLSAGHEPVGRVPNLSEDFWKNRRWL